LEDVPVVEFVAAPVFSNRKYFPIIVDDSEEDQNKPFVPTFWAGPDEPLEPLAGK
jgi:hypothetical protein